MTGCRAWNGQDLHTQFQGPRPPAQLDPVLPQRCGSSCGYGCVVRGAGAEQRSADEPWSRRPSAVNWAVPRHASAPGQGTHCMSPAAPATHTRHAIVPGVVPRTGHRLRHATLSFSSEEIVRPDVGTLTPWKMNGPCFLPRKPSQPPAGYYLFEQEVKGILGRHVSALSSAQGSPAGRPLMLRHRHRTRTSPPRRLGLPHRIRNHSPRQALFTASVNTIHLAS